MGSASAADLFFCMFVCIKYWYWADLVCGIGFVAQFGCGLHISKVIAPDFEISVFLSSLMVSDSLVLHFDTKFKFLSCSRAV